MRGGGAAAAAVVVAALLGGCQGAALEAVPQNQAPDPVPPPSAPPAPQDVAPTPADPSPAPTASSPLGSDCGSEPVLLTSGTIEPALGHRYLVLGLTNCGDVPRLVDGAPGLEVRDGSGGRLNTDIEGDPTSPPGRHTLAPGATLYLQLHWLAAALPSNPDAGHELVVRSPTEPAAVLTLRDQLDLDDASTLEVHDWAPTIEEAVQQ